MGLEMHPLRKKWLIAGIDEAGRGCLAGPVSAAAVILPEDFSHDLLNDSKKLSAGQRDELRIVIEKEAVAWAVAFVPPGRIDEINILWASVEAMHLAVDRLSSVPQHLLVDGNRFRPYRKISHECVVKGDGRYLSVAAASVLAKTHRDAYMVEQDRKYPMYGWKKNKGYPTRTHREGIRIHGSCCLHRNSFRLLPDVQIEISE